MFRIGYPNAEQSRVIDAPCETIWNLLIDTGSWPVWGPSIVSVECEDRIIHEGSEGWLRSVGGIGVPFLITGFRDKTYWSWEVAGIPATGHRVEPAGAGGCRVIFEIPLIAAPYAYICRMALERISGMVEGLQEKGPVGHG